MPALNNKDILNRAYLIYVCVVILALFIVGKVLVIQLVEGEKWLAKAESYTTVYRDMPAVRGNIYADDGSMMATSVPIYEVRMDMVADGLTDEIFTSQLDSLCMSLHDLYPDKSQREWKANLEKARQNGERYHLIKRKVRYHEMKRLRTFPIFNRGRYKGGLIVLQQNRRELPFRLLAARTIGYDREGLEKVGLEGAYSKELSGVSGKRLMQKLSGGEWMPINDDNEIEPQDGYDLHTTINLNIQDVAENALLKQLKNHDAHHGCVILMEVSTGEIKAVANLSRDENGDYWERYNYAIGEAAEPGSTFKLASLIVGIEDGYITLEDSVDTGNGKATFYDRVMRDSKEGGYGKVTMEYAFAHSSNIGIMRAIEKAYAAQPAKFMQGLKKQHLGEKLGIEIEGEGTPLVKDPSASDWSLISYLWSSIGYEVKMTPLQILTYYNAIANNGVMVKPKFVRSITDKSTIVKGFQTEIIDERICSPTTVKSAKRMLEAVVEYGTAENLKNNNYKIAGKTGTARVAKTNENGSVSYGEKHTYQASFAGYFPADNPKYSCIVVVNAPNTSNYYASHVAGPIFEEIADKVYATSINIHGQLEVQNSYSSQTKLPVSKSGYQADLINVFEELNVKVSTGNIENKWVVTNTGRDTVQLQRRNIVQNLVPNVKGMSAQDAVYLLENAGLTVVLKGRGMIKNQSIPAGKKIIRGEQITLELS